MFDHEKLVAAGRMILEAIGEDADREGLRETPERIARLYEEVFAGLHRDPAAELKTIFAEDYDEIVLVKDIPFSSMCEHHLLPFFGRAHTAYIPTDKVLGISKLARAVEVFAKRPQVQERLTNQIAELIEASVPEGPIALEPVVDLLELPFQPFEKFRVLGGNEAAGHLGAHGDR